MNKHIYTDSTIDLLRQISRRNVQHRTKPALIFVCGGDQECHPARQMTAKYIWKNKNIENVFCITAENLAAERFQKIFNGFDLLKIEALIADVCDCILLYCESAGSICELGAFSVLKPVSPVLAVGISKKHRNQNSFIMDGPVRRIAELSENYELARVFYLDFDCPIACPELTDYLRGLKHSISQRHDKTINQDVGKVNVSSLALELLDIISLFPPITSSDLVDLYCAVKGFDRKSVRIYSPTINEFLASSDTKLTFEMIIAFMLAAKIIKEAAAGLVPNIELVEYFMFRKPKNLSLETARASVLLRKRRHGLPGVDNVYNRFN